MLTIIARWKIKEGELDAVWKHIDTMVLETRKEAGCLRYDPYKSSEDEYAVLLFEQYKSEEAVEAHRASTHFRSLVEKEILPRLESRDVQVLKKA